ncbi:TonB-dependent receptor plug domain-containing protein [Sphingobium phenoxybenzoativorans]|uniref:TonB-dependent receptor plug domain-containing protein n=1 Tax=Sphingobium phenoxybenzoativorans TaxID=1592790 RepID=UPI000872A6E3|nr:TonB-dependent receptor [Sphingobium phenoxybenzoativorans]
MKYISFVPATGALALAFLAAPQVAMAQANEESTEEEESGEIVVQATRSGRRLADEPIRVDVLDREEIEEKMLMKPGNVAMILSETGGVRVQVTSPALGASNVRIQGMDGRFTQLLADGLPLYGQAASLGLLQIPPTDLAQVEVIKGAASALYGPSALGGVINLVSRRPTDTLGGEALLNITSRDGQDATAYVAGPIAEGLGASITGGVHRQTRRDLDGDGWIDMPGYDRWTVRPRLFWEGAEGGKAFLTLGAMDESRRGGTLKGRTTPDGMPFPQTQDTRRYDAGLTAEMPVEGLGTVNIRASAMTQKHRHGSGAVIENDRHSTLFGEASLSGKGAGTSWIGGVAVQADRYRSRTFPAFDYRYTSPAIFGQVEQDLTPDLTLAGSARLDAHNAYGTQFSPRFSALYRPGPWKIRASAGRGFYAPTPFVDEIEAAGLSRLDPLAGVRAETAKGASVDFGYAKGPVEANVTLFGSNIQDSTRLIPFSSTGAGQPDRVRLINVPGETRLRGMELLLRYRWQQITLTGSYVHVHASEPALSGAGRQPAPLTPRHTGGLVAIWEKPGKGRIGLETYYTGRQALENNPYRQSSKPYVEMGMMGELILGKISLFLNAENILNVRQTRYDPLLLPRRAVDGRWTTDVWSPTDGFVLNGGIRFKFGG